MTRKEEIRINIISAIEAVAVTFVSVVGFASVISFIMYVGTI